VARPLHRQTFKILLLEQDAIPLVLARAGSPTGTN
jgi:hypothetical protein